jgi:REP element-mobilizing transposase RayT
MERKFAFVEGQFYHIFNRGVEKRPIFRDPDDWNHFHQLLYLCNSKKPLVRKLIQGLPLEWDRGESLASIVAYTLMQNHFHLIVREDSQGSLSKFMGKLSTSYSMYFNTKYDRSGPLFCHPFRARHITSDEYFRWVFSYVHLNPVAEGIADISVSKHTHALLSTYEYSSYRDYFVCKRPAGKILSLEKLPTDISDLESIEAMQEVSKSVQG